MNNSVHPLFQGIIACVAPIPEDTYCPICKCGDRESHKIEVCKFCQEKLKTEENGK